MCDNIENGGEFCAENEEFFIDNSEIQEIIELDDSNDMKLDDFDVDQEGSSDIKEILKLDGHEQTVFCADVLIKSTFGIIVTGGEDEIVKIWDLKDGNLLKIITQHKESIASIEFNKNGNLMLTADLDGLIIIWNVHDFDAEPKRIVVDKLEWVRWHTNLPDTLIIGMADSSIQIMNIVNSTFCVFPSPSPSEELYDVPVKCFGVNNEKLVCGSFNGTISFWNINNSGPIKILNNIGTGPVIALEVSHENNSIFCSFETNPKIGIINTNNYKKVSYITDSLIPQEVTFHSLVAYQKILITAGIFSTGIDIYGMICEWDISKRKLIHKIDYEKSIENLIYLKENKICTSFNDGSIYVMEVPSLNILLTLYHGTNEICLFKFFNNNNLLITSGNDNSIKLFNL